MKLLKIYTTILLMFTLITSCEHENTCIENKVEYVTDVNSPISGNVNEAVNIDVIFQLSNSCGGFGKFIETNNNNVINIEVEASYEGCVCTQNTSTETINYEFIPKSLGTYFLNFKSGITEYITVVIEVS